MNTTATVVKTHTSAIFPILIALEKFKDLGIRRFLPSGSNQQQQELLLSLLPEARTVNYNVNDMEAFASKNIAELNQILKEKGFDIRLSESADMGVVTVMDLFAQWFSEAIETTIHYEDIGYPAMLIKEGVAIVHSVYGGEILKIRTKTGISVFIQKNEIELTGFELFSHVHSLSKNLKSNEEECRATIPFVTIDQQPDISWITGMIGENTNMFISQALQQNRLNINVHGVRAKSAVAVATRKGISMVDKQYVVDQPFNIWLSYDSNPFPLFAAYVAPESWKK